MDALEFIKERQRMHHFYYDPETGYCLDDCPARGIQCLDLDTLEDDDVECFIRVVETWSKENPKKTRQNVFLEQYPNAKHIDGVLAICPKIIDASLSCPICVNSDCPDCRREFWMQEVE